MITTNTQKQPLACTLSEPPIGIEPMTYALPELAHLVRRPAGVADLFEGFTPVAAAAASARGGIL